MKKAKITQKQIIGVIRITHRALTNKLSGVSDFTSGEMFAIRDTFFPNLTLEYLFKKG